MERFLLVIAGVLAASVLTLSAAAQMQPRESEEAERLFRAGVEAYRAGADGAAIESFDRLIRDFSLSHRVTGALVMKGKALFRKGENLEAAKTMRVLLSSFPRTTYAPDARLVLGLVFERIGRPEEAADAMFDAWRSLPPGASSRLAAAIVTSMDTLIDKHLAPASVRTRITGAKTDEERAFLWMKLAEREEAAGTVVAARAALDTLVARYPAYRTRERIAAMRARLTERTSVKLGALLPLMNSAPPSAMKEIGMEVFEGIRCALEEFSADPANPIRVSLEVRDTERDAKVAGLRARELAFDPGVIGILGPVFSMSTTAAAETAKAYGIPLVTPTATSNGIAGIGPAIFQANADFESRGTAMARYAVQVRGLSRLAILAPEDTRGRAMADAFLREARRLGASVIATEYYPRGTTDLKSQLRSIRRIGMLAESDPMIPFTGRLKSRDLLSLVDLGIPPRRLDSLLSKGQFVSARLLLGPDARARLDSVRFPYVFDETRIDSLEYPVTAVQGLYAPINAPEEIGVLASQVVYFHLETQMFGSAEWNSLEQLDANKRYCTGVIFESETTADTGSGAFSRFRSSFTARFKKNPGKNTVYGYDAARLVLSLLRGGAVTRESLRAGLAAVRDFQGLRSRIGLTPRRVNSWVPVMRFDGESVGRVDEINVAAP